MRRVANLRSIPDDHGFVLVGVVMFVLALTILGLSLFALSSYEGQFMDRSYDSDQALFTAQSGIEHAKFLLGRGGRLEDVRTSLFPSGVVYASAHLADGSDPDSVGPLPRQDSLEIRVMANVNGERRMLAAKFTDVAGQGLYKNLLTVSDSVMVETADPLGISLMFHYSILGDVSEGGMAGGVWLNNLLAPLPNRTVSANPQPDVQAFFDANENDSTTIDAPNPDLGKGKHFPKINLDGPSSVNGQPPQVAYYKTENSDPTNESSLRFDQWKFGIDAGVLQIKVNG